MRLHRRSRPRRSRPPHLEILEDRTLLAWSFIASLSVARDQLAAATGPDGRTYAIGGRSFNLGSTANNHPGEVDAYTPSTNTWAPAADLPTHAMLLAAATGGDGRIYAFGGVDTTTAPVYLTEAYDTRNNTWTAVANLPTPRVALAGAEGTDGRVYALGGFIAYQPSTVLNTAEVYSPITNSWLTIAPMLTPRSGLAAAGGPDGRIYAIGGENAFGQPLNTVEAYSPASNTWFPVAPMPTARFLLTAATGPDGRIYAIGGTADGIHALSTVEAYNPQTNTWTTVDSLQTARFALGGATGSDGRLYALFGDSAALGQTIASPLTSAEALNVSTIGQPPTGPNGGGGSGGIGGNSDPPATPPSTPPPPVVFGRGPNARYVAKLYADLFGRGVDSSGLQTFETLLNLGLATHGQIAQMLVTSAEYRTDEVTNLYRVVLGRNPDAGGLATFVTALDQGQTAGQVEVALLGSSEFFIDSGRGSNSGFLAGLYQVVLHRPVDATGAQTFGQALDSGQSRAAVAQAVFDSKESEIDQGQALYGKFLGRAADPAGLGNVIGALQGGASLEQIVAALVSSPEYIQDARANANQLFVAQVYRDLLGREADPGSLAGVTAHLDGGLLNRLQVVQSIEGSLEWRADQVQLLYASLLGRPADSTGMANALALLNGGGTLAQVESILLASDEFFAGPGGGSNDGFLSALYQDVLGRPIDSNGQQVLGQALASGVSRSTVVQDVMSSPEEATRQVEILFTQYLRRAPDSTGLAVDVNLLMQGESVEQLTAQLVASPEYLSLL
jgi:N-acetylneuraminic acid mutarotase